MAMVISRGPRLWIPPSGISIATDPVRSRPNWLTAAHEGADNIYATYDLDPLAPAPSAIKVHFPPRTMSNFKRFPRRHSARFLHKPQAPVSRRWWWWRCSCSSSSSSSSFILHFPSFSQFSEMENYLKGEEVEGSPNGKHESLQRRRGIAVQVTSATWHIFESSSATHDFHPRKSQQATYIFPFPLLIGTTGGLLYFRRRL